MDSGRSGNYGQNNGNSCTILSVIVGDSERWKSIYDGTDTVFTFFLKKNRLGELSKQSH